MGAWIFLLAMQANQVQAFTQYAGNGIVRVMSANNVYRGDLWFSSNITYGQTNGTYSYKDGKWFVNVLYGLRHWLELGVSQTLYQDRALTTATPAAGPLRISIKAAMPSSAPQSFNYGAQLLATIPIGAATNTEFESYVSPATSLGFMMIASLDSNPIDLRRSKRVHLNLGYVYFNDKKSFGGNSGVTTSQFLLGVAFQFPVTSSTMIFTELFGERFINAGPSVISANSGFGPQNYWHFTPGIRQQLHRFALQTGIDIRPNQVKNLPSFDSQPAYPRWKFFATLQIRFMEGIPPTYRRGKSMRISGRSYYQYGRKGTNDLHGVGPGVIQNLEERQELMDQVERDLQEIREQRIKAQRELEDLKKALEKQP